MKNIARSMVTSVAQRLAQTSKVAAAALPDSKGGETPKQLQNARTEIYTYFTVANGETMLMYSAERWVRIKLTLETAGPVAIGTAANLEPVLSGRGILLDTDRLFEAYLPKGARVYIISETVNRVSVTVEPVPWMEQLSGEIVHGFATLGGAVAQGAQAIVNAIAALRGLAATTSSTGTMPKDLPIPPPGSVARPRLTPLLPPQKNRPNGRR